MKSHSLVAPLSWAALYFVVAYFSYVLNGAYAATGYIWWPAGVTVSALLLSPVTRWFPLLVLLLAAQILLGWLEHRMLWRIALLTLNEIGIAALIVALVRRTPLPLEGLPFVRGLLLIGTGASLISGVAGASWLAVTQHVQWWPTLRVWSLSNLVGILIITHVLVACSGFRTIRPGAIVRTEFLPGLLAFAGVLLSAYLAFDSEFESKLLDIRFSSTYLPLFFIVLVTLLWGACGGALSVAALGLIAFVCNSSGQGPFAELVQLHSSNALLELQVYLALASLLSLTIGAVKTRREQTHVQVARWQNEVEIALDISDQLAYSIDLQDLSLSWRGDVAKILGLAPGQLTTLAQVLALVHPLDQARLRQRWLESDGEPRPAARESMSFRLQLPDGRWLMVTDRSRSLRDAAGQLARIVGVWQLEQAEAATGGQGRR